MQDDGDEAAIRMPQDEETILATKRAKTHDGDEDVREMLMKQECRLAQAVQGAQNAKPSRCRRYGGQHSGKQRAHRAGHLHVRGRNARAPMQVRLYVCVHYVALRHGCAMQRSERAEHEESGPRYAR